MKEKLKLITNGIFNENPVLRLVLGTCATLAISTSVINGLGMGAAATFVLIGSNMVISALRKVIPDKVRIPAYITIIAGFVTVIQMLIRAFVPSLYDALGIFLPLIVVNCIILGRAEMFANKNTVIDSMCDGIGMGLGFTLTLFVMGTIRELLGKGTWCGLRVIPEQYTIGIITLPPGGFFVFGVVIALLTALLARKRPDKKEPLSECGNCGSCGLCAGAGKEQTK